MVHAADGGEPRRVIRRYAFSPVLPSSPPARPARDEGRRLSSAVRFVQGKQFFGRFFQTSVLLCERTEEHRVERCSRADEQSAQLSRQFFVYNAVFVFNNRKTVAFLTKTEYNQARGVDGFSPRLRPIESRKRCAEPRLDLVSDCAKSRQFVLFSPLKTEI